MAKKVKKKKLISRAVLTPAMIQKNEEVKAPVPTHLHIDIERTITALDLHMVKQKDRIDELNKRIDRLVDAISKAKKVKGI